MAGEEKKKRKNYDFYSISSFHSESNLPLSIAAVQNENVNCELNKKSMRGAGSIGRSRDSALWPRSLSRRTPEPEGNPLQENGPNLVSRMKRSVHVIASKASALLIRLPTVGLIPSI